VQIRGYFQSERYFAPIAEDLRRQLKLTVPLSEGAIEIVGRIAAAALPVSIHIRRGDYLTGRNSQVLDLAYFRRAHELMSALVAMPATYFIFSDDYSYAAANFDFLRDRVIVRGNLACPWEDLVLMSRCRHHIIANSSFSWWGAWLGAKPEQVVVAPARWFRDPAIDTADLVPPTWTRI
jgi:glycosyl transferase family 11